MATPRRCADPAKSFLRALDVLARSVTPYQQIADALREEIRTGALQPGDRLPTVVALGERFGVAKMTAEKALKELRSEGLIVSWQGRGIFVRDASSIDQAAEPSRGAEQLTQDVQQLKKQYGRLEGLLMHLYSRVGEPFPHEAVEDQPKKRRSA